MHGGAKFLATAAILAVAGCGGERPRLQIRPTATPLSATARPVPFRIAEAHSHLALSNVALAIESFRKALREEPDSVDAMAGLAACYDQMARFDLSRRYYEAALAVSPADAGLLNAFARSLDLQGHSEEAADVRREISVRLAATKPPPASAGKPPPAPAIQTPIREELAAKAPAPVASPSVTIALPPPRSADVAATLVSVAVAAPAPERPVKLQPIAAPAVTGPPVTVTLPVLKPSGTAAAQRPVKGPRGTRSAASFPPASVAPPTSQSTAAAAFERPMRLVPTAAAPAATELPPVAVPAAAAPTAPASVIAFRDVMAQRMEPLNTAPRLERISPGEVTLVTTGGPLWSSKIVTRTARSTTVRFVQLRTVDTRPVRIRLLNAALHQGLAARTRRLLALRGWRQLAVGNARRVRQTSLILYPANRRATAVRLSAQFGIPIAKRASGRDFVMLLGRDVAKLRAIRG